MLWRRKSCKLQSKFFSNWSNSFTYNVHGNFPVTQRFKHTQDVNVSLFCLCFLHWTVSFFWTGSVQKWQNCPPVLENTRRPLISIRRGWHTMIRTYRWVFIFQKLRKVYAPVMPVYCRALFTAVFFRNNPHTSQGWKQQCSLGAVVVGSSTYDRSRDSNEKKWDFGEQIVVILLTFS